jgi:tetratricopeptide (TPR) repeat protein
MLLEVEYALWGLHPKGYHLASVLLHVTNSLLLFSVIIAVLQRVRPLQSTSLPTSELVGAAAATTLFAIHPLRVEVVAWASCQPYLPCATFYLLAVLAYLRAFPTDGRYRPKWFWASFAAGTAAVLSKAVGVSLPFVLVVLDIYPLRRPARGPLASRLRSFASFIGEKWPHFMMSAVLMAVATIVKPHVPVHLAPTVVTKQVAQAAHAIWFYLAKAVAPTGLSTYYGISSIDPSLRTWAFMTAAVATVLLSLALFLTRRRFPSVLAAWTIYLIILAPNLGIVRIGNQVAADRYSYVAQMSLIVLLAGGMARILEWLDRQAWAGLWRLILALAMTALIVVLTRTTWAQGRTWSSSEALWRNALEHGGAREAEVHNFLGLAIIGKGRSIEAEQHWHEAIRLNPRYADPVHNIGTVLARQGRFEEAAEKFREALALNPHHVDAKVNLGAILSAQGDVMGGLREFVDAAAIDPESTAPRRIENVLLAGKIHDGNVASLAWTVVEHPENREAVERLSVALGSAGEREADPQAPVGR